MIRSTKVSLKFANPQKLEMLSSITKEYQKVVAHFVDVFWETENYRDIPPMIPSSQLKNLETSLTARAIQCAAKQASGIVRGTRKKYEDRLFVVNELRQQGLEERALKLEEYAEKHKPSKPKITKINPDLDSRFVQIDLDTKGHFNGWVTLKGIVYGFKMEIPIRKTKHLNLLAAKGTIKDYVRIDQGRELSFAFEIPDVEKKQGNKALGIDLGYNNLFFCSNGISTPQEYFSIRDKIDQRKKGSKGIERARTQRSQFIKQTVKQLNLENYDCVNLEKLSTLLGFVRKEFVTAVQSFCEEHGVRVNQKNCAYTSQRCSCCGWTDPKNRNKQEFVCVKCEHADNADYNASRNISFNLIPLWNNEGVRIKAFREDGFYWVEARKTQFRKAKSLGRSLAA